MSDMSKAARAAMKAKASRMGGKGDPKTKVDASSWTPPEMMNTGMKVGMRPLTRRAFRKGGKVIEKCEGGPTAMRADRKQRKSGGRSLVTDLINRNAKKANLAREGGDAHVGGYKKGGRLKRAGGGDSTVEPLKIDNMGASPAEIAATRPPRERYVSPKDTFSSPSMKGRVAGSYGSSKGDWKRGGGVKDDAAQDKKLIKKALRQHDKNMHGGKMEDIKLKKGGPAHKGEGGSIGLLDALMPFVSIGKRLIGGKNEGLKSGGRTKKQVGGGTDKKAIPGDAPTRGPDGGSQATGEPYRNIDELMKAKNIGKKRGGGTYYGGTRPTGGRMPRKAGGRTKGKTNIVISINAGKPDDQQAMMPKMPTPSPMPVPPIAPPGMGAGAPPPMPMPMPPPGGPPPGLGGPPGMPPMPRKSGGRAYRSYKDMDAGALGGMGRLEKTEIEHGKRSSRR